MGNAAAAVAHTLGLAIEDLIDCNERAIETPDGDKAADLADTLPTDRDTGFIVELANGTRVLVSCTEVPR